MYKSRSFSGRTFRGRSTLCLALAAVLLVLFGASIWLIGQDLSAVDELLGSRAGLRHGRIGQRHGSVDFDTRTVVIENLFPYDVSLYSEDGSAGSFLGNISPLGSMKVSASSGHVLYITEQLGMTRLSTIIIRKDVNQYTLQEAKSFVSSLSDMKTHAVDSVTALGVGLKQLGTVGTGELATVKSALHGRNGMGVGTKALGTSIQQAQAGGTQIKTLSSNQESAAQSGHANQRAVPESLTRGRHSADNVPPSGSVGSGHKVPQKNLPHIKGIGQAFRGINQGKNQQVGGVVHPHDVPSHANYTTGSVMSSYKYAEINGSLSAHTLKILSMVTKPISVYFDDGKDGFVMAFLVLGQHTNFVSYVHNTFYYIYVDDPQKQRHGHFSTVLQPTHTAFHVFTDEQELANGVIAAKHPKEWANYQNELKFNAEYKERTGLEWVSYYGMRNAPKTEVGRETEWEMGMGPRLPTTLHMQKVKKVGDVINITSTNSYWLCDGVASSCKDTAPLELQLESVALSPNMFVVHDFMSDFEADAVVKLAAGRMAMSIVGDSSAGTHTSSNVRNSENAWLARHTSSVTDTIFRRAADILGIPEHKLWEQNAVENLQVVRYQVGQKYDTHVDWIVAGKPNMRFLTLVIYLKDQADANAGGETAFPAISMKVSPKKGMAVLFYNLLEDGNGDPMAMHAALPVKHGEKYMANFWVWDPVLEGDVDHTEFLAAHEHDAHLHQQH